MKKKETVFYDYHFPLQRQVILVDKGKFRSSSFSCGQIHVHA